MRYIVAAIIIGIVMTACTPSAPKKAAEIAALEKTLDESSKKNIADTTKLKELLADYGYYADHFATDSLTPIYLMRMGDFDRSLGLPDRAIACYHRVYTDFPGYPKANFGMFLEGFTYENDKHDLVKAKECYTAYLQKYPNTKMSHDVKFLLSHLGMTPEQIMAEMDSTKKAAVDSASTAAK